MGKNLKIFGKGASHPADASLDPEESRDEGQHPKGKVIRQGSGIYLDESFAYGIFGQAKRIVNVQFLHNMRSVCGDGLNADIK